MRARVALAALLIPWSLVLFGLAALYKAVGK